MREAIRDLDRLLHIHECMDWKLIIGMRHVLVHGYYTTSKNFIWATVQQDLPTLRPQIEAYIAEEQAKR